MILTSTEAGALGAMFSIVIAFAMRRLDVNMLMEAVSQTVMTCAGLFVIAVGATMLTRFLSLSGTGDFILNLVTAWDFSFWQLITVIVVIYLILGCFMDPFGAMLLTLPIFLPILEARDIDLVWFGVLLTKLLETGMITPPFGLNVFVIKGVVGNLTSLVGVFKGVTYYIAVDIIVVVLAIVFPDIIMAIPHFIAVK